MNWRGRSATFKSNKIFMTSLTCAFVDLNPN